MFLLETEPPIRGLSRLLLLGRLKAHYHDYVEISSLGQSGLSAVAADEVITCDAGA